MAVSARHARRTEAPARARTAEVAAAGTRGDVRTEADLRDATPAIARGAAIAVTTARRHSEAIMTPPQAAGRAADTSAQTRLPRGG